MQLHNYLKRKYSTSYVNVTTNFNDDILTSYVKDRKYKIGKLLENYGEYKKGTLFLFNIIKVYDEEVNSGKCTGDFDMVHIFKNKRKNDTVSGYSSDKTSRYRFKYDILKN